MCTDSPLIRLAGLKLRDIVFTMRNIKREGSKSCQEKSDLKKKECDLLITTELEAGGMFDTCVHPGDTGCHLPMWEPENCWWHQLLHNQMHKYGIRTCALKRWTRATLSAYLLVNTHRGVCGDVTFPPWTPLTPLCRAGSHISCHTRAHTHPPTLSPVNWRVMQAPCNFRALQLGLLL